MKKNYLFALTLIALMSVSCSGNTIPNDISFELEGFSTDIEFHTSEQLNAFIGDFDNVLDDTLYRYLEPYDTRLTKEDMTLPLSVELKWDAKAKGGSVSKYTVEISEEGSFAEYQSFTSKTKSLELYNLKRDTTYYWRVKAYNFVSEVSTFKTNDTVIRNLYVDGVNNVRDIGGYGQIKQGMIYRGGSFEKYDKNAKKVVINVTAEGVKTLLEQLAIKTEVDLRRDDPDEHENCDLTKSSVSGLAYVALPLEYHNHNILTWTDDKYNNPLRIKQFFELLAEESNYPIYMHCSQGKDRTGCLAYLVEALMNVDETSRYMDYLFSSFSAYSNRVNRTGIDSFYGKTLSQYGDASLSLGEKTYKYLHEVIGVSEENLNTVKQLLGTM